jgi:peptidoglycan LD-endopeptidase LytH
VGHARGDLVDVVGHEHERRRGVVPGETTERRHELLAAPEVEPGGRLVEEHHGGIVHQRAGEQHALLLTRRQRAERAVGEAGDRQATETLDGPLLVGVVVLVPPRFERGEPGRLHDVRRTELWAELGGERGRRVAHAPPQGAHVGPPELLAEHVHRARRGVLVQGGDPHERGLAAAVRAEQEPAMFALHPERDRADDLPATTGEGDVVEVERGGHPRCVAGRRRPVQAPPPVVTGRTMHRHRHDHRRHDLRRAASARRRLVLLVGVLVAVSTVGGRVASAQSDDDEATRAAQEIAAARDRANAAADAVFQAEAALALLESEQVDLRRQVVQLQQDVDDLRTVLQDVAVSRFVTAGAEGIPVLTDFRTPYDRMQAGVLSEIIADTGAVSLDDLDAAAEALDDARAQLQKNEADVVSTKARMEQAHTDAEAEVEQLRAIESQRLQDEAVRKAFEAQQREEWRRVEEVQRRLAAADRQGEAARRAAAISLASSSGGETSGVAGKPSGGLAGGRTGGGGGGSNPRALGDGYVDAIMCPVQGASAWGDTWGAPRSGGRRHQGVDMLAAIGTPLVAVVSGTVSQEHNTLGGTVIKLFGDNGNRYYYAHLSRYEGAPGRVEQGQVIGYMGDSGNATGIPHLHFEIHPGGGLPVNPTPSVSAAGC